MDKTKDNFESNIPGPTNRKTKKKCSANTKTRVKNYFKWTENIIDIQYMN